MLKKIIALLMLIACLCSSAAAEDIAVYDLLKDPGAEFVFEPGAEILEIIFPKVFSCDICFVRVNGQVMMIDSGSIGMRPRIEECMSLAGIDRINTAFITHPHDDHIGGLTWMLNNINIGHIMIATDGGKHWTAYKTLNILSNGDFDVTSDVWDGYAFGMGGATFRVIMRGKAGFSNNDRSAMLRLEYGERTMLFASDIEITAQGDYGKYPPSVPLKADILKYPHHGLQRLNKDFRKAVDPVIAIATAGKPGAKNAIKYMKQYNTPVLCTAGEATIRLRTDGSIWVIDDLGRDKT